MKKPIIEAAGVVKRYGKVKRYQDSTWWYTTGR